MLFHVNLSSATLWERRLQFIGSKYFDSLTLIGIDVSPPSEAAWDTLVKQLDHLYPSMLFPPQKDQLSALARIAKARNATPPVFPPMDARFWNCVTFRYGADGSWSKDIETFLDNQAIKEGSCPTEIEVIKYFACTFPAIALGVVRQAGASGNSARAYFDETLTQILALKSDSSCPAFGRVSKEDFERIERRLNPPPEQ
jgi:hypothetical protein